MGWRIAFCDQCKRDDPVMFILKEELWKQIATNKREMLCLDCVESRLGRKVTFADLKPCGITDELRLGAKLASQTPDLEELHLELADGFHHPAESWDKDRSPTNPMVISSHPVVGSD